MLAYVIQTLDLDFIAVTNQAFLKDQEKHPDSTSFSVFSIYQDKKGISGKQIPAERRTIYQRHIRPSTMLAKSILEGNISDKYRNMFYFVCVRCF